jgi:hypothetical protein
LEIFNFPARFEAWTMPTADIFVALLRRNGGRASSQDMANADRRSGVEATMVELIFSRPDGSLVLI